MNGAVGASTDNHGNLHGSIDVIVGPMFAGKTSELLARVNRFAALDPDGYLLIRFAEGVSQRVNNGDLDDVHCTEKNDDGSFTTSTTTAAATFVYTHCRSVPVKICITVDTLHNIEGHMEYGPLVRRATFVAVDEGQFFGDTLVPFCRRMARAGKHVTVAGLALDYRREPFRAMADLSCYATHISRLTAICVPCHMSNNINNNNDSNRRLSPVFTEAVYTWLDRRYTGHVDGQVLIGASEKYVAVCGACYEAYERRDTTAFARVL